MLYALHALRVPVALVSFFVAQGQGQHASVQLVAFFAVGHNRPKTGHKQNPDALWKIVLHDPSRFRARWPAPISPEFPLAGGRIRLRTAGGKHRA